MEINEFNLWIDRFNPSLAYFLNRNCDAVEPYILNYISHCELNGTNYRNIKFNSIISAFSWLGAKHKLTGVSWCTVYTKYMIFKSTIIKSTII